MKKIIILLCIHANFLLCSNGETPWYEKAADAFRQPHTTHCNAGGNSVSGVIIHRDGHFQCEAVTIEGTRAIATLDIRKPTQIYYTLLKPNACDADINKIAKENFEARQRPQQQVQIDFEARQRLRHQFQIVRSCCCPWNIFNRNTTR